jgi:hypothetical protein
MGYSTDFEGYMTIKGNVPKITQDELNDFDGLINGKYAHEFPSSTSNFIEDLTEKGVLILLNFLQNTRRMKRNLSLITDVPNYYGIEGEFFVHKDMNQGGVVDHNKQPSSQPSLWCLWVITENNGEIQLEWNGEEKFYEYKEWLEYYANILNSKGMELEGYIQYQGDDEEDFGTLDAKNINQRAAKMYRDSALTTVNVVLVSASEDFI